MRCVCNAKIKYSGLSSTVICGTEWVGGENAEISAFSCYRFMKNVDKHLEEVRVGRSRLETGSCRKTRENCQLISSDILLMYRRRFYMPFNFFNTSCIIQMESLMRTYLLFKNLWGKQHFCISAE